MMWNSPDPRRHFGGGIATLASTAVVALVAMLQGCVGASPEVEETGTAQDESNVGFWVANTTVDGVPMGKDIDGTTLYACRATAGGRTIVGKTRPDFGSCHVPLNGSEVGVSPYQTLAVNWAPGSNGSIPPNASSFGADSPPPPGSVVGDPLYPCRASLNGGLQLGKIKPAFGACAIPFGGQEVHVAFYNVMTGLGPQGIPAVTVGGVPPPFNAIIGGHEADGTPLYVCNGSPAQGGIHPGKMQPSWTGCDIGFAGQEIFTHGAGMLAPRMLAPGAFNSVMPAGTTPAGPTTGVCTSTASGGVQVGEYVPASNGLGPPSPAFCHYAFGGREITVTSGFVVLSQQ